MKKQPASWKLLQMAGLVMFIVLFVQLSPAMAQNGLKPGQHTVERPPKGGGTTTVEREGPCVIDLTAPKTTGSCNLGVTDPPAKVVVKNWYRATGPVPRLAEEEINKEITGGNKSKYRSADYFARYALENARSDALGFWTATPITIPDTMDTAPGTQKSEKRSGAYSKEELEAAKSAMLKWAQAWKNYRGSRFGKGK